MKKSKIHFRKPISEDGFALHQLIQRCPPLDTNSVYCNLLQCTHFADSAIVAVTDEGDLVGSISGYVPPSRQDTLFVWQVALDPEFRGAGIARNMLQVLFDRMQQSGVRCIETTISPGNAASENLFISVFEVLGMPYTRQLLFGREQHFAGQHDDELLYRAVIAGV